MQGAPVSTGSTAHGADTSGCRFFAGSRSDPSFFFDVLGVTNKMRIITGEDYFADRDVCSIALELPNSILE